MLQNWLRPLPGLPEDVEPEQLGNHILRHTKEMPPLGKARIVLLGVGQPDADAVRQQLYRLSYPFPRYCIADLGNARRTDTGFLIPLIKELIDSKLFPVIIGNAPEQALAQYKAFQELQYLINLVAVDERIAYRRDGSKPERYFLKELLDSAKSRLFHLNFIGCQAHFTPQELFDYLDQRHFDYTRLGQARSDLSELEPAIRDGDLLSFHIAALQQAAAPGQAFPSPNGFTADEACQICRYAGMSDKLKAFGLYGFRHEFDWREQTAQLAAQMVWYTIDGFFQRAGDFPASTEGLSEYIVDFKGQDYQLTFWKSEKSGRWWMQVPVKTHHKYQRHRLVPCSYNDYLQACQDELPERLLKALERFG